MNKLKIFYLKYYFFLIIVILYILIKYWQNYFQKLFPIIVFFLMIKNITVVLGSLFIWSFVWYYWMFDDYRNNNIFNKINKKILLSKKWVIYSVSVKSLCK